MKKVRRRRDLNKLPEAGNTKPHGGTSAKRVAPHGVATDRPDLHSLAGGIRQGREQQIHDRLNDVGHLTVAQRLAEKVRKRQGPKRGVTR
jgi:hypothetical protein